MYNIYVEEKRNKKIEFEEKEKRKFFRYKQKFKSKIKINLLLEKLNRTNSNII